MRYGRRYGLLWGAEAVTPADELLVVVKGEQLIHVQLPGTPSPELLSIDAWSIAPNSPSIAVVEDLGGNVVALHLDRPMLAETTYTISILLGDAGVYVLEGETRTGDGLPRQSSGTRSDLGDLLDVDAPVVRSDRPGGDWTIDETGDYKLTGGMATVVKMAWDALLTLWGELYWDPLYGMRLRHKEPARLALRSADDRARARAVLEALPYVNHADVSVEAENNHARIRVVLGTRFGPVEDSREVTT